MPKYGSLLRQIEKTMFLKRQLDVCKMCRRKDLATECKREAEWYLVEVAKKKKTRVRKRGTQRASIGKEKREQSPRSV
jgi:predicted deacetylase